MVRARTIDVHVDVDVVAHLMFVGKWSWRCLHFYHDEVYCCAVDVVAFFGCLIFWLFSSPVLTCLSIRVVVLGCYFHCCSCCSHGNFGSAHHCTC